MPSTASRPPTRPAPPAARRAPGFTLVEMMVVVAIIAILAMIALPGFPDRLVRGQIVEAVKLAEVAKAPVALAWAVGHALPANNAAAGLPPAEKIVGNLVSAVAVENGAIQITFGNQANPAIRGKVLSLRPGVVDDAPVVPVAWVCGHADAPVNMAAKGPNRTSVEFRFLPLNCRGGAATASAAPAASHP